MSEVKEQGSTEQCIVFREFSSVNEAEVIKSVLESAGIWSMINNEYMSTFYPVGVIYAQLIIKQEDQQRAEDLIKD
ncbi:MAG: DUF2007 domain-containing protein [Rikenellaceae bacterium]